MDYAKVLTGGVSAWLRFESACDRSGLFSEKYLTAAIGQILSGRSGNRTVAEYKHPLLAPLMKGPGRRPEVDFVVRNEEGGIVLAVESKWAGRTKLSTESILWDLIRLELIAHHEGARCMFLLAGSKRKLEAVFEEASFSDAATKPQRCPLLRHDNNVLHSTPLVPTVPVRIPMLKKLFGPYPQLEFPEKLVTRRSAPSPLDAKGRDYQVYAWEVLPAANRRTFRPGNSKHYGALTRAR
jgi:hypothetical protein